jgi:hypothetical protein
MNNHSLPVTTIVLPDPKRSTHLARQYRRGLRLVPVRAMVVKLSDEMTAPLRQRSQILRGKVAEGKTLIWPALALRFLPSAAKATATRTKKGLDVEKR